ncbi:MAG TPA: phenylalanine--tRNA ligase subunit beta [Chloroflexi bacterium]|nr:phenylalanine--tRNA ligase subunit beta [Chloroflexota bacterium]
MLIPLSWLKDFVDIDISVEELAQRLTLAGLEVEAVRYVGLPMPQGPRHEFKISGLEWPPDKFVVAAIHEVRPHPNADRLVLCRLDDGEQEHIVLTGAPSLLPLKGKTLEKPLKVAYAREGARLYNGHAPGWELITLKRAKIRGVVSYSMVCSEKELGISEEMDDIIYLPDDAPVGTPLADYLGDAVFDIAITPNMARNANVLGVARETAAILGKPLRKPSLDVLAEGAPIEGQAAIQITNPDLNPRFMLGLIRDVEIKPSPFWVQMRLKLAGMRPINNIVDATNYVMLETGEPLHAFDYDVLVQRAGGKAPTIITRTAHPGEKLTTLDGVERTLDDFTVLVCDTAGPLSIAGVMGGEESEVTENTRNVLLEAASWNFINIRRTVQRQRLSSEAAYRFSRGVHPTLAEVGLRRGLELMRQWSGGTVAQGFLDEYPNPPHDPAVTLTEDDIARILGIRLGLDEIADLLTRLEFTCTREGDALRVQTPPHRLDIGEGIIGKADLAEEVARLYGYDRLPTTRIADELPPQRPNPDLLHEQRLRETLVNLGLREVITYRLTSPEWEAHLWPPDARENAPTEADYVRLVNPIAQERRVLRRSLLASMMEVVVRNSRNQARQALFEIAPVFLPREGELLPQEPRRAVIALTGQREAPHWEGADTAPMDFYDLKGVLEALAAALHLENVTFRPAQHPSLHPGKCAEMVVGDQPVGVFGELHPAVAHDLDLDAAPVLLADLDAETLLRLIPEAFGVRPVPAFPPVREDLAVVVDEDIPAADVEAVIRKAGGKRLADVRLFDVYRGEQIGAGKKSLAYRLTYQDYEKTLTDKDAAKIRKRIVKALQKIGAQLRG